MSFKVIITSNYIFIFTDYEHLNISFFKKHPFRVIADLLKNQGMVDFVDTT